MVVRNVHVGAIARIVPVVRADGQSVLTGGPAGQPEVALYQVVGGACDGRRGSFGALVALLAEAGVEAEGAGRSVVLAETGEVLGPAPLVLLLGHAELRRLEALAAARGVSPAELLANFAADLTAADADDGVREAAARWLQYAPWPSPADAPRPA